MDLKIFAIIILVIIVIVLVKYNNKKRNITIIPVEIVDSKKTAEDLQRDLIAEKAEQGKRPLTFVELENYKQQIYEVSEKIKDACINFDYNTLNKYTTPEVYNQYYSELTALEQQNNINIIKDFNYILIEIKNFQKTPDNIILEVKMMVSCYDYIINKESGKVISGDKDNKVKNTYNMTFIKPIDNKCPNCNKNLEYEIKNICPYCNSAIIKTDHSLILTSISSLSQY